MKNRFKNSDPSVKHIEYPDEYPSHRIAKSFRPAHPAVVTTLSETTCLEQQYEEFTRTIKAGGAEVLQAALKLTEVEDQLFAHYCTLSGYLSLGGEEKAQEWLRDATLLAKDRAKTSVRRL